MIILCGIDDHCTFQLQKPTSSHCNPTFAFCLHLRHLQTTLRYQTASHSSHRLKSQSQAKHSHACCHLVCSQVPRSPRLHGQCVGRVPAFQSCFISEFDLHTRSKSDEHVSIKPLNPTSHGLTCDRCSAMRVRTILCRNCAPLDILCHRQVLTPGQEPRHAHVPSGIRSSRSGVSAYATLDYDLSSCISWSAAS